MPDQNYCEICKLDKTKKCTKCNIVKPVSDYDKHRRMCKECRKVYNSKYYQTQKDIKSVENSKL